MEETAVKMASLLAKVNGERADNSSSRVLRDKAYTHLREVIDEVRATGRYVFWKDEIRLKSYRSAYARKRSNSRPTIDPSTDNLISA